MKIGFIGLGNVGGKLAGSLLRNGIDLTVHDLDPDLVAGFTAGGAKAGDGPAQMMRDCDAIITCLPSPAAESQLPRCCSWMPVPGFILTVCARSSPVMTACVPAHPSGMWEHLASFLRGSLRRMATRCETG